MTMQLTISYFSTDAPGEPVVAMNPGAGVYNELNRELPNLAPGVDIQCSTCTTAGCEAVELMIYFT